MTVRAKVIKRLIEVMSSRPNLGVAIREGVSPDELIFDTPYGESVMTFQIKGKDIIATVNGKEISIPLEKFSRPELVY
ncbi:MAG: hypothetical protein A3H52_00550 [Candidatus Zambryskibacteria bacterium RIFCSPLOWO2_02_FULL_39_26]|uniref:Uncharacterized protein n=1 Tax=Candidatus Zambryskibacteria bacterium RIFCSPLOWO2_12_FULL_39_23 TaxID=1802776 RepID=A0A1G2UUX7_9BACT|nr:MAG: hypothetical protein A3H52_00550 [Candidatus Zambryskibacteria bacterium RIFCSPLOWO2_02_FULL_39_26]OHB13217.1 MAG: hypothetical protein A3G99_01150 [Candidatus Zambryskibacteria bacterium RIFCSPLOWO2_12_FULL_39_23]